MSDWAGITLKLYNQQDDLVYQTSEVIEASGSQAWMEIGRGAYVIVPFTGTSDFALYNSDYRVYVYVINQTVSTGHTICDFIIESTAVEEMTLPGGGTTTVMRISGRDQIKQLAEMPSKLRHISKWRTSAGNATAITPTTLQMGASDKTAFASMSLIGWTIELLDGNWSEIVGHTVDGLITIDPAWQKNANDPEDAPTPAPPVQRWRVYGGAVSETTGDYTDLKLVFSMVDEKSGWSLEDYTYKTTATGTYLSCTDYSVFKTLQQIAAQSGEYFVRIPGERGLLWRREIPSVTHPSYGNPLQLVVPFESVEGYSPYQNAFILPGADLRRDTTERATRVRPTGGGGGDEAVTLKDLPAGFSVAAGYQVSGEYLIYTAAEAGPIEVAKELRFDSIAPPNDNAAAKQLAAQALYRAALAWLKEHQSPRIILDCEVLSPIPIAPVTYVHVVLTDYGLYRYKMYVLSSTANYKDGIVTYTLQLSDKKAPILDDERIVAQAIRETGTQIFTYNAPSRNSRRLTGGIKGGGGGGDSHPPVTSGNAAIAVAPEQVVSLSLAAPSGMEVTAGGLSLADSVAGSGLGVNNKTLYITLAGPSGLEIAPGGLRLADSVAGSGLGINNKTLYITLAGPSGLEIAPGGLRLADSVAGNGLGISNKVLSVNVAEGGGLQVVSDALAMYTPGTITAVTTNQTAGNHTHAVTAYSDGKANLGGLLKSSAQGDLTLRWLTADKTITPLIETAAGALTLDPAGALVNVDGNMAFTGSRQITTTSGSLTLAPAQTLIIDPPDDIAQINSAVTLKTAHWSSGFLGTGWGITYAGEMDMRKIYADELHVMAFIADTARVKVGAEYITPSMALLSRRFTIPNVGSSDTLYVEDAPGLVDLPVFADGDWVLLRIIDRSGGGLLVANAWGQVYAYSDLSGGEQSWTFTTRNTTSAGKNAERGAIVLDFGKTGDGWWWVTTLDPAGSPYAGITTWTGNNPYDEGNRTHRLRMGQLRGVTGAYEWGLQAGTATSSFVRFSDLRSEIHGSRLSLYAGDNAQLRVATAAIQFFKTAGSSVTLTPDADHNSVGVESTHATFYQTVDEAIGSPNVNDYIRNAGNRSGFVTLGLSNPTSFTNIFKIRFDYVITATGFVGDTIRLYAQVMAADEVTPLTGEMLAVTRTSNTGTLSGSVDLPHDAKATSAAWNGARLKLRWEYEISAVSEAIRLDPNVPSIAVGNALPTGPDSGGDGLWVGRDGGAYKMRLGKASGVGLRWDGDVLSIRNSANQNVIEMNGSGNSLFAGVMNIGSSGGIWQAAAGTFAAPKGGLKIWNDSGVGRLATYDSGGETQVFLNSDGALAAGTGRVRLDKNGLTIRGIQAGGALPGAIIRFTDNSDLFWASISADSNDGIVVAVDAGKYLNVGLDNTTLSGKITEIRSVNNSNVLKTYIRLIDDNITMYGPSGNNFSVWGNVSTLSKRLSITDGTSGANTLGLLSLDSTDGRAIAFYNPNVAHGITGYSPTNMYGWLSAFSDLQGGLEMVGVTEGTIAQRHISLATTQDTSTTAGSAAAHVIDARLKSGAGAAGLSNNANLLAVRNYGGTKLIVKGNGDIHANAYTDTFDVHDDIALVRTLERHLGGTVYDAAWDDMVRYNADSLMELGLISDGGMVNISAWLRLLSGAIWQLYRSKNSGNERAN